MKGWQVRRSVGQYGALINGWHPVHPWDTGTTSLYMLGLGEIFGLKNDVLGWLNVSLIP